MVISAWFFVFIFSAAIVLFVVFFRLPSLSGVLRIVLALLEIIIPLAYIASTYMNEIFAQPGAVGITTALHDVIQIYQQLPLPDKFATALSLLIIASGAKDAADFINSFFGPNHRPNSNGPDGRKEY